MLWLLLFLRLPGEHEEVPWLSLPAPSLYNQRGRDATRAAVCPPALSLSSCLPQGPSRALGVQLELGGQRGPLHPRAVLQGKPCFPSKGCTPGPTGLAGGQGPWLSLGWWLGATEAARAAIPPRTGPVGAVNPLSPLSLCRAGLPQAWLWMEMVWGGPTLLCAAPGAALLLGRGWSSSTIVSSLSLAPFT